MIFIVTAENRALFGSEVMEMHRQRKSVFVDSIGWNIPVVRDMEIDRYDREDTTYLIAKAAPDRRVLASVRLLPTVGPHLMGDLFFDACRGAPLCGPAVWEVSRFCVAPEVRSRRTRLALLWEITCGVIETALLFGIEQVTFATNSSLLPLVLDCGWQAAAMGPTLPDGDDEITAVAASIAPHGLRTVRQRFGVPSPVTRFLTPHCVSDERRAMRARENPLSLWERAGVRGRAQRASDLSLVAHRQSLEEKPWPSLHANPLTERPTRALWPHRWSCCERMAT